MTSNPIDFTNKRVVIIGGSSGIGNGMAHEFRKAGAEVLVTGTRPDAGDYLESEDSDFTGLTYHQLDVCDQRAVCDFPDVMGEPHVLVQCQGTVRYKREEFVRSGWDPVVDVNLNSVMDVARAFHSALAHTGGSMIIVSSVAGFKANIGNPAYSASKAGAVSLVKTLGAAWARDGVRVNGIAPGLVPTKLTTVTTEHPERLEGALKSIPMRRMGTPEDMAGAAMFLASPLSSYMTGQTLVVDGGLTLS
ncbi:MAG: SDR family oxidoreductase [Pseudomonadota bacterium]